jgi:hypothetical protein
MCEVLGDGRILWDVDMAVDIAEVAFHMEAEA